MLNMKLHIIDTPDSKNGEYLIKNILEQDELYTPIDRHPLPPCIANKLIPEISKCAFDLLYFWKDEKYLEQHLILQKEIENSEKYCRMSYVNNFHFQNENFVDNLNGYTHQYIHFNLAKGILYS